MITLEKRKLFGLSIPIEQLIEMLERQGRLVEIYVGPVNDAHRATSPTFPLPPDARIVSAKINVFGVPQHPELQVILEADSLPAAYCCKGHIRFHLVELSPWLQKRAGEEPT